MPVSHLHLASNWKYLLLVQMIKQLNVFTVGYTRNMISVSLKKNKACIQHAIFLRELFCTTSFLQDPLDPCPGVTGNITQYRISFQTGSVVATRNVTIARCTAGRCGYNFEPPKNLLLNYDSVSVAAENVLGMGFAKTCTTQTISKYPIKYI